MLRSSWARAAVTHASEIRAEGVQLQLAFVVGPHRNWLSVWKPTIDALDPLPGRTRPDEDWHSKDGRIIDLELQVGVDASLGHDVLSASQSKQTNPGRRL